MNNGILSENYTRRGLHTWTTDSKSLFFALFIPLACMLFLLEWEPKAFVFVFLSYTAAVAGYLLARYFPYRNQKAEAGDRHLHLVRQHNRMITILHRIGDNRNVYVSPSIRTLLGYDPEEILCKHGILLLHPEDREALKIAMDTAVSGAGSPFSLVARVQQKEGGFRRMDIYGKAIAKQEETTDYVLLSLRDAAVLEKREPEAGREMMALTCKPEGQWQEAAGNLPLLMGSHDLKEPLRTVKSYVKLLKEHCGTEVSDLGKECIHYIDDGIKRMEEMINDILSLSSMEKRNTSCEQTDIGEVLKEVLANLNLQILEAGATISFEPLPELPVDRRQFRHLFQNLIQNAIKYCDEEHPEIQISWLKSGGHWQFRIEDNGIGIEKEYQQSIFEVFRRLHAVGQYTGSGLGLAICHKIIDNHRGRIWVESEGKGKGSSFCFAIPVKEDRNYATGVRRSFELEKTMDKSA